MHSFVWCVRCGYFGLIDKTLKTIRLKRRGPDGHAQIDARLFRPTRAKRIRMLAGIRKESIL